jgi:energy-coupling factor transport system ATP-binding protein
VGQPALLLLDEPFTALDFAGRATLARILLEERARGAAILLSSHDLEAVAEVAGRAVLLADGRILATATRRAAESVDGFAARIRRLGVEPSIPTDAAAPKRGADA